MQFLPSDILGNIFNFLPRKDAIRFEILSSQFRELPYKQKQEQNLIVQSTDKDITFSISLLVREKAYQTHIGFNRKNPLYYLRKRNRKSYVILKKKFIIKFPCTDGKEGCEPFLEEDYMTFLCCTDRNVVFEEAAKLFKRILRRITFSFVTLTDLPKEFFDKLGKLNPPTIFENTTITFMTKETRFSERLKQLLCNLEKIRFLEVNVCEEFEGAEELFNLPAMQSNGKLLLLFGTMKPKMKLKLDAEFLQKLIDRRFIKFQTDAVCTVAIDFLADYVKDCLYGRTHPIRYLQLHFPFQFDEKELPLEFTRIGFREINRSLGGSGWWERKVENAEDREGYDPDKILICFGHSYFRMTADFARYRDRESLLHPDRCFDCIDPSE